MDLSQSQPGFWSPLCFGLEKKHSYFTDEIGVTETAHELPCEAETGDGQYENRVLPGLPVARGVDTETRLRPQ